MKKFYLLEGQKPVRVHDPVKWAQWLQESIRDRLVGQNLVNGVMVRTVFTGLDLESRRGRPYLFEGYAWRVGEDAPDLTERYCSWNSAVEGHNRMVDHVSSMRGSRSEAA